MASTLIYNGIQLPFQRTELTQDFVYDPTGVDRMYNHVVITAQALINPAVTGMTNASFIAMLRTSFSEPRGYLQYFIDGSPVIIVQPGGDAKNGPIVSEHHFELQGTSVVVLVKIETWVQECAAQNVVLSNRWETKQDIDKNGYSTLTHSGLLIIRPNAGFAPDNYRGLILPVKTVPSGFQRISQSYTQSPDNTALSWQVIDQEHYRPGVNNISDWEGTWREASDVNMGSGAIVTGTLTVRATAPKNIRKDEIFYFITQVALSRINFTSRKAMTDRLQSYEVVESLDKNEMALNLNVIISDKGNSGAFKLTTRIGGIVNPLDSSSRPTTIDMRGTALAKFFSASIVGTCTDKTGNPSGVVSIQVAPVSIDGVRPKAPTQSLGSDSTNALSQSQLNYPYLRYDINSHFQQQPNVVQMPVGTSSSGETSAFPQLAQTTSTKLVNFSAERIGIQPELPRPDIDDNHVLLGAKIIACDQRLMADGLEPTYFIEGNYQYGLKNASIIGSSIIKLPRNPMIDTNLVGDLSRQLTSQNFVAGIIS